MRQVECGPGGVGRSRLAYPLARRAPVHFAPAFSFAIRRNQLDEFRMVLSPLGDSALLISLGEEADDTTAGKARAVADALRQQGVSGVVDVVPVFATVAVYYDITRTGPYADFQESVREIATRAADAILRVGATRTVEIPVCYGGEFGPDLAEVARAARLDAEAVIALHAKTEYRVYAIGFVPGFGYLGGLPKALHTPRRATPRPRVPAGSVGIGGVQTGIYPLESPGGWNLIGRTPLVMFDPARPEPARLHAGDRVRFRPITAEEFAAWN